ncbi:MAG: ribosome maturation factor RimM [Armatimonadota bacterium]|nr:ribosome maturation factor RimM [Armatimonadota bacterium]MCX7777330.1 ribosome maturation factor RimM [Armatimonadota bacterium]MDW8024351.1 ribosome maturation factor RimM [Armatimonadota bacterium]
MGKRKAHARLPATHAINDCGKRRIPILRDPLKEWTKVIGEIVSTHGLDGSVKLIPLTELMGRFKVGNQVCLVSPTERRFLATIERSEIKGNRVTLKFEGINSADIAERLIGWQVTVHPDEPPPLERDEFLISDLLGMTIITTDGRTVGEVIDIMHSPAHDLFVTERGLIPITKQFVREIDFEGKHIVVDIPEGLIDWGEK